MNDEAQLRKAQTAAVFNRLASDYDAAGPGCFAHFGQKLVEKVGVRPGQAILDVATGRGAILFAAAERVGRDGKVVGIDLAEAMVEATKRQGAVWQRRSASWMLSTSRSQMRYSTVCCAALA